MEWNGSEKSLRMINKPKAHQESLVTKRQQYCSVPIPQKNSSVTITNSQTRNEKNKQKEEIQDKRETNSQLVSNKNER